MKVLCIKDDWKPNEKTKHIFEVGEALPEKGKIYEVIDKVYFDTFKYKKIDAYLLKGFNFSAYNIRLCFKADKFEIIEEMEYVDNLLNGEIIKTQSFLMVVEYPIFELKSKQNES